MTAIRSFETPREGDLGLRRIGNGVGPVGQASCRTGASSPSSTSRGAADARQPDPGLAARRRHRPAVPADRRRGAAVVEVVGPGARVDVGAAADRFVWEGETPACATG